MLLDISMSKALFGCDTPDTDSKGKTKQTKVTVQQRKQSKKTIYEMGENVCKQ